MTIARKPNGHLAKTGIDVDVITHGVTASSRRAAQLAHVSGGCLARTVVLHDGPGSLLAVVGSAHRVEFDTLMKDAQHGRFSHHM